MLKNLLLVSPNGGWKFYLVALLFFSGVQNAFSQADYAIQGASVSPTSIAAGRSFNASGSIYNLGNVAGSTSNIGYYISTNNTLDEADTFIGSSNGGTLNAGASSTRYATLTIPANTANGSYYLLFVADYLNAVAESNENNNVSSVSFSVVPSSVDFLISSAYLYTTSLSAGSSLYLEGTISNQGNIASTSSSVGYYLSTNTTLDAADVFIGSFSGSGIQAGTYNYFSSNITIPANTTPGSYHLIMVADYLNSVNESNENNNTLSRALTVVAPSVDLIIQSASISNTSVSPGTQIYTQFSVYNQGNTTASSSNAGLYLSTNATLDASDTFIGSSNGSSLAAGGSSYRSTYITIPANTAPGTYYILHVADYLNSVQETNEDNNVRGVAISVVAPFVDLNIQSPYVSPTSVAAGAAVSTQFYISNLGNATSPSSNAGIYLSTNTTLDASDVFIGSSSGGSLSGNNYATRYQNVTIPSNTTAGTYYVLFVADYLNSVTESNENNNVAYATISVILPFIDLALQSASLSSTSVSAGNPITAYATVYNTGNTTASSTNIGYYLSTNTTLDANDILIDFSNGSSLAGNNYAYRNKSITIPGSTEPGNYYLIQAIDYLNAVTESNENNNTVSTYLSITAQGTTFIVPQNGSTSFSTCTGKVYDNGGTGSYANYSNGTLTINPGTSGTKVQLSFLSFSLEGCCDYLQIYDGTSTSAPLIGSYSYNNPGVITASSESGALTLRFYSDGSSTSSGFEADIACVTPSIDLVLLSAFTSASTLSPGNSFTATSFIANTGSTSSPSSVVGYYLSANNTLETTDVFLGNSTGGTLTSGNSAQRVSSLVLPGNTTAGSYNLIFVADPMNAVSETNETNNTRTAAITVTSSNTIDLAITARTLAATTVAAGASVNATGTLSNTGTVSAPRSTVGFYLSTNTTLDESDILLTSSQTASTLAASGSEAVSASLTIPAATASGSYYILFVPDPENHIAETDETNGTMSLAITVSNNTTDLVVQNAALSSTSLLAGQTVTATSSIRNQGSVTAISSNLGYYLSINDTFETSDVSLGTTTGGSLAGTTSAAKTATLTLPAGTAPGDYFVLFVADPSNTVTEGNETNNVAAVKLTILAPTVDLIVQSSALSASSVVRGNTLNAATIIQNTGTVAASSSAVGYYLSSNNTLDDTDVLLATSTGGSLGAKSATNKNATLTIPAGTPVGNYFILFVADPNKAVSESNEGNNVEAVALAVTAPPLPDLVVSSPSAPSSLLSGSTYTVSAAISNIGNATSSSSNVGFYLSADNELDANDVLVGTATGTTLTQGSTSTRTATITIPSSTAAGTYRLFAKVDPTNSVSESDETNNLTSLTVTVSVPMPDFIVSNTAVSSSNVAAGDSFTASVRITNRGNASATTSNVGFYLSSNMTFESNDLALGTATGEALAAGANANREATLTIPVGTPPGVYYLLFVADPANAVAESNENNNVINFGFRVAASSSDLLIESPTATPSSIAAGGSLSLTSSIKNNGEASASSSTVGYYLSTNATLESSDVSLGSSNGGSLAAGIVASRTASVTIPAGTSPGNYFILFVADHANAVTESNENNNVSSVAVTVTSNSTVQKPDLSVQKPTISKSPAAPGEIIQVTTLINNIGNASSPASKVYYYLSSNTTFDNTDVLFREVGIQALATNAGSNLTSSLTIPSGTADGDYYVLVIVDMANSIDELNEGNNINSIALRVGDPTGITNLADKHGLKLWPNPAADQVTLEASDFNQGQKTGEVIIYSAVGEKVFTRKVTISNGKLQTTLNLQDLGSGVYLVYIKVGDTLAVRRLAIEK